MSGRILSLAMDGFGRSGFQAISVGDLLKGSGISKPTLYHHFCSKDRLIAACVVADCERLASRINASGQGSAADLEELVRTMCAALAPEISNGGKRAFLAVAAAIEFRDDDGDIRQAVKKGFGILASRLVEVFAPLLFDRAEGFAQRTLMLLQGASISSLSYGADAAAAVLQQSLIEIAREYARGLETNAIARNWTAS